MVTVLLMLLMLGVLIHSSQALLECHQCTGCDEPTGQTCHIGDVCIKARIRLNYAAVRAITPFKVIQGHRVWYQSKAHMRLPISD